MRRAAIPIVVCLVIMAADLFARPPDTLDFGAAKYHKTGEMLYRNPVRHVMINETRLLPYALVFDNKIEFLDRKGRIVSESPLPPGKNVRVSESAHNKFIAVYGNITDSNRGFIRLFDEKGSLLFSDDNLPYDNRAPSPLILESRKRLIFVDKGTLSALAFNGDTLATTSFPPSDSVWNGDISSALCGGNDQFSIIANRYLIPTEKEEDRPRLYRFDSNLEFLSCDTLPYLFVSGLSYTPDGKYFQFQAESGSGPNQTMSQRAFPSHVDEPLKIEASFVRIAVRSKEKPFESAETSSPENVDKKDIALIVPRRGYPQILISPKWNPLATINLPTPELPWVDVALSPDGQYALFYNDDELVFWNSKGDRPAHSPFPYSFKRCFISDGGKGLLLAGEFGFVVYELAR